MTAISLDTITFSERGEAQIDWADRLTWSPVGQSLRYALGGNVVAFENVRGGRPITLTAELPWSWLTAATVEALYTLAAQPNTPLTFTWSTGTSYSVLFRRDAGPLDLIPLDPRRLHYTGSIFLITL